MTIGTNNRMDYLGDGSTETFPYGFKVFSASDLKLTVSDTGGIQTVLTYPTHFSVTNVGRASGGNVVLSAGAFSWLDVDGDLAPGFSLTIRRVVAIDQTTDIRNQSEVFNDVLEDTFDALVMIDQQQQDEINRSLKFPEGDTADATLPTVLLRANKLLGFDANGDVIAEVDANALLAASAAAVAAAIAAQAAASVAAAGEGNWTERQTGVDGVLWVVNFGAPIAKVRNIYINGRRQRLSNFIITLITGSIQANYVISADSQVDINWV